MRNLITELEKAVSNGQTLMSKSGELVQENKVDDILSKSYITGLKGKSINLEISFKDWKKIELEENYFHVSAMIAMVKGVLNSTEEQPSDQEPQPETPSAE